jgi:hypothetical protein
MIVLIRKKAKTKARRAILADMDRWLCYTDLLARGWSDQDAIDDTCIELDCADKTVKRALAKMRKLFNEPRRKLTKVAAGSKRCRVGRPPKTS